MTNTEILLEQLLSKMTEAVSTLEEISGKLNNIDGVYSLDDLATKLTEGTDDIVGSDRYNLTEIHHKLNLIDLSIIASLSPEARKLSSNGA